MEIDELISKYGTRGGSLIIRRTIPVLKDAGNNDMALLAQELADDLQSALTELADIAQQERIDAIIKANEIADLKKSVEFTKKAWVKKD